MKKTSRIIDKQNEPTHKQKQALSNPINEKIQKFGKSIRARLSQKIQQTNRRASQPLQEAKAFNMRQSEDFSSSKPILDDISAMSVSYICQPDEHFDSRNLSSNSRNNMSKMKSVKFLEVERCESASMSKSLSRKSHSILKNSQSSDKLSSNSVTSHIGSISGGLSIKSSLKDKGIDCENKKYQTTLKMLIHQNKKFFDDMFPPGSASLFHSKILTNTRKDIRWMRVDDVYRGHKLILYNHEDRNCVKTGQFPELNYMATCFNALGTSHRCLERIFENQQYSKYGIYHLRLNHQGIWKYTIVDDFIPVRQVQKGYEPIFMTVNSSKSNYVQIWPLILQKALAKMYSTYECLFNDSVDNLMQDLTGIAGQSLALTSQAVENQELRIKSLLMSKDNIIMAQPHEKNLSNQKQPKVALVQHQKDANTYFTTQTQLRALSIYRQKSPNYVALENLHHHYKAVQLYQVDDSYYSVGCVIKQQLGTFSLRVFKVSGAGRCVLSVIQKDKKYFRNNGYEYCWMRIMLVCKDLQGYRYINGAYSNKKTVFIDSYLTAGEYFILVCGDWTKKVYDVTLNYQGNLETQIKRQPLSKYPNLIDQTCRDIAQRFGTFIQINKNVCSYQYCDRVNGLVIENFNNQVDRQVYFHRTYKIPFKNYNSLGKAQLVENNKNTSNKKSTECQLETFLEPDGNLTLILLTIGGIDQQQMNQFRSL